MSAELSQGVEPCIRCGAPAEWPALGSGRSAGQEEGHVPLCLECLQVLLADPAAFREGMWRQRRQASGPG
jgi:hypothetical protein